MANQHIVTGFISKTGSTISGTGGFIVDRIDNGVYSIIFQPPFLTVPVVVTSQVFPNDLNSKGGSTLDNSVVIGADHTRTRIKTGGSGGHGENRDFTFIAMGVGPAAEETADEGAEEGAATADEEAGEDDTAGDSAP